MLDRVLNHYGFYEWYDVQTGTLKGPGISGEKRGIIRWIGQLIKNDTHVYMFIHLIQEAAKAVSYIKSNLIHRYIHFHFNYIIHFSTRRSHAIITSVHIKFCCECAAITRFRKRKRNR